LALLQTGFPLRIDRLRLLNSIV
jgi:hypothetical protein